MNQRIIELISAAAKVLASVPDAVTVTERNGTYHIDAHPKDLGAIMGRQRKHATAIEFLAQELEAAAVVRVASRENCDRDQNANNPGLRTDWTKDDESKLKSKIEHLLRFIYESGSVQFRPAVRESVYVIPASYVSTDVVGALHVLFRAYGRRHGRYITITVPTDESHAA